MLFNFCRSSEAKIFAMTRTQIYSCPDPNKFLDVLAHVTRHVFVVDNEIAIDSNLRQYSPRDEGWLEVSVGKQMVIDEKTVLTLSDFASKHVGVGGKFHRWFKNYTNTAKITQGVYSENEIHQTSRTNLDIYYSEQALNLIREGGRWKQFIDGNIVFTPLHDLNKSD